MKIATNRGVVVGELLDGVYTKVVKGSTHKIRKPAGWSNQQMRLPLDKVAEWCII